MSFVRKTKIEKAWIVASVLILVAHKLLEGSAPLHYEAATYVGWWLKAAMTVLSFPFGGMTAFALYDAMFWCDGCRDLEWLLDWPTLLFAGYIQWFWMLPEFLRARKLTLLDLKRPPETVSPGASPANNESNPAAFDAAAHAAFEAAPLPAFDAAAFVPRHAEFDEAGLTALDRVFQAQALPAAPPSPHVEAIFPRVS